jgi:hypothetical protein
MDWEAPAGEDVLGSCATGMGKALSIDLDSCGRDQVASGAYSFSWTAALYCMLLHMLLLCSYCTMCMLRNALVCGGN